MTLRDQIEALRSAAKPGDAIVIDGDQARLATAEEVRLLASPLPSGSFTIPIDRGPGSFYDAVERRYEPPPADIPVKKPTRQERCGAPNSRKWWDR